MDEVIGPGEAARRLGVSTRTVQRWLRTGALPVVQVGSRRKVRVSSLSRSMSDQPALRQVGEAAGPTTSIRRLLVANRGELVVRIARSCRRMGIATIALVTDDQRAAWWTGAADEIVPLATDYLDGPAIVEAAVAAGADAIHPGYGFLAERPDFAEVVLGAGLTWVGPPPDAMRALGDKAAARRLAARVEVPILPGYDGRGQSDAVLAREATRIGYPVLVKPSAGGGGKGMHVVRAPSDIRSTLATARREAAGAFGDDRLILERYLDRPRHVEVQLLLDSHGNGIHLGERDCSLQRRHQKVVEEAPAPDFAPELRARMGEAALRLARAAGYQGAGTAEFLLDDDGSFVFLEMNARLQVEHPVTEAVTGVDLVAAQLRLAAGEPLWLRQADVAWTGHAVEARLYAEDPWNGFLPAVGRVAAVHLPEAPGLRLDVGVGVGDEVGTRYDPLLAKLIASGSDRAAALETLRTALEATRTLGVTTNRGFLAWLLRLPEVVEGDARADTIETHWHPRLELPEATWPLAAFALAELGRDAGADDPDQLDRRAGFRLNGPARMAIELEGQRRVVPVTRVDAPIAAMDASRAGTAASRGVASPPTWVAEPDGPGVVLDVDGRAVRARLAPPPTVESAVRAAHHGSGAAAVVAAPMPGVVSGIAVAPGDKVEAHQVLVVLEAMKMENAVTAPTDGRVEQVLVRLGQAVQRGDVLVELSD